MFLYHFLNVLKMPKYGEICDSEIQISRGYIRKNNGFKPFITG